MYPHVTQFETRRQNLERERAAYEAERARRPARPARRRRSRLATLLSRSDPRPAAG